MKKRFGGRHTSRSGTTWLIVVLALLLGAKSESLQAQPTISKVFTPNVIGPGNVSTITFTITNNDDMVTMTGLAFSDVLPTMPGPMVIADPANATTNCDLGISGNLSAPDGGTTIALSDARIGTSQSCTIKVDVTASTPGAHTNPAITLNSSAGSNMSLPIDLTVTTTLPGFTKSFAPSSVPLGNKSTLTFTIDNTANTSLVPNLDFTDNLPTGIAIADPANAATDCISAGAPNTTLTAAPGTGLIALDANGSALMGFEVLPAGATCTVTVDVTTTGLGMLDNVTGNLLANSVNSGKASDTLNVTVTPIAIRKSFVDDPLPPGGAVTLNFTLDNLDRNFAATGIAFTDDLTTLVPALPGLSFASLLSNSCGGSVTGTGGTTIGFTGGNLGPESACTVSVGLAVPANAVPGAYTNTTGSITGTVDGFAVVGNMASDDLFVVPAPRLTKTFVGDPVNPGDPIVLDFTVTNTSTTSSATNIAFEDNFNTVLATASVTPGNDCCGAGSTCTFTPLSNPPPPGDAVPARLAISGGTLAPAGMPGDSCAFAITLDVSSDAPAGIYPNVTSAITATVDLATRTGAPASDSFTVIAAPDLTKEFIDDPVAPGTSVTLEFVLSYSADASGDATNIAFTDDLAPVLAGLTATGLPLTEACDPDGPGGMLGTGTLTGSAGDPLLTLTGATLAPGESCVIGVSLDVPTGAAPGSHTNTTSGVSATVQGLPASSAPASDDLNVAGLTFSKEFTDDPVIPGGNVTLRFTIANIHPMDDATNIDFTDNLAAVLPGAADLTATLPPTMDSCGGSLSGTSSMTYTGGSVTTGSSCTIEIDIAVPAGAPNGAFSNTTSTLTATQGSAVVIDPAVDVLTVDSNLLQLSKAFIDDPVAPGDSITLEFNLTNLDPGQAASSIAFSDDVDAALEDMTFDSVLLDNCGGTVTGTGTGLITVTGASLAAAGSCTIRVSLSVPVAAAANFYSNTTSAVTGTIGGLAVTGDPVSDVLEVLQLLIFSKSFDGPTTASGMATLTFTITNPGTDTATNLAFSDDLNATITNLIATSLPAVPCGAGSSVTGQSFLAFNGGELAPAGMCSFAVDVLVPMMATAGSFPNMTSNLFRSGLKVADPATANLTIEPPPIFTKVFAPDFIGLGLSSTLTFTIDNSASALAASSLAFTDNLPAGVVIATPTVTANTCGGSLTAVAGASVISLSGSNLGAGASCTIAVDVVGTAIGAHVNTTGNLSSSSGNSGTASDTLSVNPPPLFAKSFSPNPIAAGGTSTLTFTIDNSGSAGAASALDFTDNLPTAVIVANPPNDNTSCTGGSLTASQGSNVITYTGGEVAASASCTVVVDVTSNVVGMHANTSGNLTSVLGMSGTATDTLTVNPQPGFTKSFAPAFIATGDTSTLSFTIDNTGSTVAASALDFTDNLPPAVVVATPANASTTCTGGTLTAGSGTGLVTYTGGTVAAGASCTVSADVTSSVAGTHVNTSGNLTSSLGTSAMAMDILTVNPQPGFAKSFAPDVITAGDTTTLTFTIDNTGSTVAITALDFTDNLPAAVTVATPANANTTCTGGTLTATSGTGLITYTGGTLAAGASCTVSAEVTSVIAGMHVNTSGNLTSSLGTSATATDTLTVNPPQPGFAKQFSPAVIATGDTSTLTFTIDNTGSTVTASALDFTDNLPAAVTVASPANATTTCIGGTLTAASGTALIAYTGGSVTASTSCTLSVDVTSMTIGAHVNLSGDLTSSLGNSGTATDTLNVDGAAPIVTAVTTVAGPLASCDTVRQPVTGFTVTVQDDPTILNAGNLSSYLLVAAGPDGDFSTNACGGGTSGDDIQIQIVSLALSGTGPVDVTLNLGSLLSPGLYRLFVCDTISDDAGNALDGDGDMTPGGDFVLPLFRADPFNLFANGHFDDCPVTLSPWMTIATAPNAIQPGAPGTDDADSAPLSGSARVAHSATGASALEQCVPIDANTVYRLDARFRFDPPGSATALFARGCEFFTALDCMGTSLGSASSVNLLEDQGGVWSLSSSTLMTPIGAVSALCDYTVQDVGIDPTFDLFLDDLNFGTAGAIIFRDSFEPLAPSAAVVGTSLPRRQQE